MLASVRRRGSRRDSSTTNPALSTGHGVDVSKFDATRLAAIIVGILLGYALGRLLYAQRRVVISFWSIIVAIIVISLVAERVAGAVGLVEAWEAGLFPLVVGTGVGVAVTAARPPRRSAWWQIWRE